MDSHGKETLYFLFRIMDTVAWETPAIFAISVVVTFFFMGFPLLNDFLFQPFPAVETDSEEDAS